MQSTREASRRCAIGSGFWNQALVAFKAAAEGEAARERGENCMNIANKTVMITGANRGIGRALLGEALGRRAKKVYAATRTGAFQGTDERVTPLMLDVTSPEQIRAAAKNVDSLDVLINSAGIDLHDDLSDRAGIERHLAVNLFGTYGVTQAFLPFLVQSRGAVINLLSLT